MTKSGKKAPKGPSSTERDGRVTSAWSEEATVVDPPDSRDLRFDDRTQPDGLEETSSAHLSSGPDTDLTSQAPLVEVMVSHQVGPAPTVDEHRRILELWTRNRIYVLDSVLTCTEVLDRAKGTSVSDHPFLGARLVGGQTRRGESFELSVPYPRPGSEAVFQQKDEKASRFARTSPVVRVVLRLHVLTVTKSAVVPTWEEVTSASPSAVPSESI